MAKYLVFTDEEQVENIGSFLTCEHRYPVDETLGFYYINGNDGDRIPLYKGGYDGDLDLHYNIIDTDVGSDETSEGDSETKSPTNDVVNSPAHYTKGRFEVIDVIEDATADAQGIEAVCQANALKYVMRYRYKNGVEDLRKSIWYIEKLIDVIEAREADDS